METIKLRCKRNPITSNGIKTMDFTKGKIYEFRKVEDPEGWETKDDDGDREVFFRLDLLFEEI